MVNMIKHKLSLFHDCRVTFTRRANNSVAHYLAKHALNEGTKTWIKDVPNFLRGQLCKDIFH